MTVADHPEPTANSGAATTGGTGRAPVTALPDGGGTRRSRRKRRDGSAPGAAGGRRKLRSSLAWRDLVGEAGAAITRRPGRSLLTALGTVVGVGAFVATTGLASTAQAQVGERFDALAATEVRVTDNEGSMGWGLEREVEPPFTPDASARLERLNGVVAAGVYWTVPDDDLDVRRLPEPSRRPLSIDVMAADPGALTAARPTMRTGTLFNDFHEQRAERVAVLGSAAADELGIVRVDNQPAVFIGQRAYTVVGILESVDRNPELVRAVILPASTADADFENEEAEYAVLIEVAPGAAQVIAGQAAMALRPQDPGRLEVNAPPDPGRLRQSIEGDITGLLYGLAGLALLVGMIGIANTTLVAVLERRSEIGVRRALGARRRHIASQFLTESATLGLLGGLLGTSLGILTVVVISAQRDWTTTMDPWLTLPAPIIGAVTGLLAGLQPAWRAARIAPATALRSS